MSTTQDTIAQLEMRIGEELGVGEWVEMTQEKFDQFAKLTGDADWIHNDPERSRTESPFGGKTIAQGHLLLSHLSEVAEALVPLLDGVLFGLNYGYDKVRIINPVTVGSRIRGRLSLMDIRTKNAQQYIVKCGATVEAEGEERPALVAEWLFFVQLG